MEPRRYDPQDRVLGGIDRIIKTLSVPPRASRAIPSSPAGDALNEAERAESVRLMRVNHAGEVAAQALYQGQALTSRDPMVTAAMHQAAAEEVDHLAWCEQRLRELKGRTSLFNPIWYFGSLGLGALAGTLSRGASLGFVAETEKQVESHLRDHLGRLSARDLRSRAILEQMTHDEVLHGAKATSMGGKALPFPIAWAMRMTSRLMTLGAYWI
jgi:ubiquinone biosynthesis monooxygenase Coq7